MPRTSPEVPQTSPEVTVPLQRGNLSLDDSQRAPLKPKGPSRLRCKFQTALTADALGIVPMGDP